MQLSDFSSPVFYADPYPLYEKLRAQGDLLPLTAGLSLTTSHALINALLCDRRMGRGYLHGVRQRYGEARAEAPVFTLFSRMMLMDNPPRHTRTRTLLMRAFNARQIGELRDWIQDICAELIDRFIEDGHADLMQQFALPLPVRVICRLLDLPFDDALLFAAAVDPLVRSMELAPMNDTDLAAANAATLRLQAYFADVLAERRQRPGKDLISLLLTADDEGEQLDDEELIANLILLFIAGHETTANMLGNTLIALHRHPQQWCQLLAQPEAVPAAVTECLRFDASVQLGVRVALEDVEILGHALPAGHIVYMLLGAANRDPAVFTAPNTLNINRQGDESRIQSFGGGVHYCLGARLARMELEMGLGALITRLPRLRLDELDQLQWHHRNTLRGVERLAASW